MEMKPLNDEEVVVHVPKGTSKYVKIVEAENQGNAEITVQVSKKRKSSRIPVLGVIVK